MPDAKLERGEIDRRRPSTVAIELWLVRETARHGRSRERGRGDHAAAWPAGHVEIAEATVDPDVLDRSARRALQAVMSILASARFVIRAEALMHLLLSLVLAFQVSRPDPLLSRLAGQWSGTGTVLNQPSKIEMTWSWELGGQFLRLTFRNEMPKPGRSRGTRITGRRRRAVIAGCGSTTPGCSGRSMRAATATRSCRSGERRTPKKAKRPTACFPTARWKSSTA